MMNAKSMPDEELFYGHKACAGCGCSLAVRLGMKVFGPRTFTAVPACCMAAVAFTYPHMPFQNNALIAPFAATGAMLSGIAAGARSLGLKDFNVVGFAGDGGTADIGLQALSGAIDRGDRVIYICYDNEAYMNTGIQKSGLTPYGTRTTTTPAGENMPGSVQFKKNMFEIVAAHDIAYAATASVGYPQDYLNKLDKARNCPGTSYIHVLAPCPTGWGTPTDQTVAISKDAVDCGLWYLAEYENGEFTLNKNPREFLPLKEYLAKQSRYKHLKAEDYNVISAWRDKKWAKIRAKWRLAE